MDMRYKEDWEQSRKRFEAFWHQEIVDRCCIAITSPLRGKEQLYWELKSLPRLYGWGDPEAIIKRSVAQFEVTRFGGESFPGIWLNLGPSGHAGFFKGTRFDVNGESVWFTPTLDENGYTSLEFDSTATLYELTMSMAKFFVESAKGEYFISMPDTSGNLDALAHLRGNDKLLMDMAMEDEGILHALDLLQKVWERIISDVYSLVKTNNDGGSMIYWIKSWAPGLHSQMQGDISVMISPDLFKRLIVPELEAQSDFLEYPLYHLDGSEQVRHLDHLLGIRKLKAIQWTSVAGQAPPSHHIDALKRIQASGKSLLISLTDPHEVEPLLTNLSSKGLYLVLDAENEDQADTLLTMAARLTHE
jgi:hypothetical protein